MSLSQGQSLEVIERRRLHVYIGRAYGPIEDSRQ
jgi:hypothetical protein